MTKLEQCARAAARQRAGAELLTDAFTEEWIDRNWQNFTSQALAIIEALYEPNEEMIDVGRIAWLESASDYTRLNESIAAAYRAMLNTIRQHPASD